MRRVALRLVHRRKHDGQPFFHLIQLLHLQLGMVLEVEAVIGTHDGHWTQLASDGFGRAVLLVPTHAVCVEELGAPPAGNHAMRRPEMVAKRIEGDVLVTDLAYLVVFALRAMMDEVLGHKVLAAASLARDGAVVARVSQMPIEILLSSGKRASDRGMETGVVDGLIH